jgi:hypothetical protein
MKRNGNDTTNDIVLYFPYSNPLSLGQNASTGYIAMCLDSVLTIVFASFFSVSSVILDSIK